MSMSGVSITSSKGLQFESTQEAYNRAIIKLNLLLIKVQPMRKRLGLSCLKL